MRLASLWSVPLVALGLVVPPCAADQRPVPAPPPKEVIFISTTGPSVASAGAPNQQVVYVGAARSWRGNATEYATCTVSVNDPHWSKKGGTAVFKTNVRCAGNMRTIRVQVRTFLARQTKTSGLKLVAGSLESRNVVVNQAKPETVYCPKSGIAVKTHGRYRGAATLTITEPGGVKTEPQTKQTKLVRVPR